jgi:hypothetical protein
MNIKGNHRVRSVPCDDQFLCIAYTQHAYYEVLRGIKFQDQLSLRFTAMQTN